MKVTCTGRRVTLKPSFIENAEKRLAKLDKFFPDEAQAQVTVTVEKSGQTVEIMLRSRIWPCAPKKRMSAWKMP